MIDYTDLNYQDWVDWLNKNGEKPFHAKQIIEWIFQKGALSWREMSNLSLALREKLTAAFRMPVLEKVQVTESDDKETYKFLWRLIDKSLVESVLICSGERRTLCVSSQVGCPAKCAFCASGQQGFKRNLRAAEIIEQLLQVNHWLLAKGERISHVVFMGMGEPLKNYEPVVKTIRKISDPQLLNISQRPPSHYIDIYIYIYPKTGPA